MSIVKGIHHISMKTCNEEEYNKVVSFYKDMLELDVARAWDNGIMFDTGNGLLEIFKNGDEPLDTGVIRHFAFAVDDVNECIKRVTDNGYEIFMGPKQILIPSETPLEAKVAFCYGPLGEEVEFFQEL